MLNHNVVWRSTFFRAFSLGRELAELGHAVTIATISPRRIFRAEEHGLDGVRIVETPDWGLGLARTGWDPFDALWRRRRFLGEAFDVVHGFDCRPAVLVPSLALARRGTPWVSDWADCWGGDGGAISQRKGWIGRVAFRPLETWLEEGFRHRARALTVTSRTLAARAEDLGIPASRVTYVPSGANVRAVDVRDRSECRRSLGLPVGAPVACFVGFVQYDLEFAIRSFAAARARVPDARLLLVGPRNLYARRLVERLGIDGAVSDFGPRPFAEIPGFLGAADALLLPMSDNLMNRARGPIKLGDYLAAGRAIVANPVGDLVDVFRADDVGLLAGQTPEEFGAAIAELLSDAPRAAHMGATARRVAEGKYAWKRLAPALLDVYRKAAGGGT
jgi:glycosyltransferase involved in cell wall biosynthesis